MTYWIVFSLMCLTEEITDIFLSWFPFYYEFKICILLWLISPTTRGASVLYRGLVHPTLISKEDDIDRFLANMAQQSYTISLRYARVAAQKFTKTMIETAIKGGGGLVTTLKRSVSMNDLNESDDEIIQERQKDTRRRLMTKSWHEGYIDGYSEDTEDSNAVRTPTRTTGLAMGAGAGRPHRDARMTRGSARIARDSHGQRSLRQHTTSETRQSHERRRHRERQEDDIYSDPTDSPVYSTLPRTTRRGSHRSQPSLEVQQPTPSRKSDPLRAAGSLKASSGRSVSNLQLAETKRRPVRAKHPTPKITKESPKQEAEFSMSYSDIEEKKTCSFM